jgi:hypothetical protein
VKQIVKTAGTRVSLMYGLKEYRVSQMARVREHTAGTAIRKLKNKCVKQVCDKKQRTDCLVQESCSTTEPLRRKSRNR